MSLKLSIIIPCYNCERTLREAVESCYLQGFTNDEFELVMVNDGSSDDTQSLMETLSTEHENIKLFNHDKNRGGGTTRNTAVAQSSGKVIFCLDSDDLLPPNTLRRMYDFLAEKKCDGVCFNYSKKFKGDDINNITHIDTFETSEKNVPLTSLLLSGNALSPVVLVFMYTRNAFDTIGGYPVYHGFDTQGFGWRFLSSGLKAFVCPNATYMHRVEFTESYYLREYSSGKSNYNNQCILMEHQSLFTSEAKKIIQGFDCTDFTKDIMCTVQDLKTPLVDNYENLLGTLQYSNKNDILFCKPIARNSLKGLWLRTKAKFKNLI